MIISHSKKFIFTKPRKVAGTSVEVALAQYCGPEDIITENISSREIDDSESQDFKRNDRGFFNHMSSRRIKKKIGEKIWHEYFTFTIVRNPWDMVVSRYFWNKKNATPRATPRQVIGEILRAPYRLDLYGKLAISIKRSVLRLDLKPDDTFDDFLKKLPHNISNTKYYFDRAGNPLCDMVMRYEHLQEDFDAVCDRIGIPHTQLPQLKTKVRTERDYTTLYTDETRELVARLFKKEIEYFGYQFGK